MLVAAGTLVAGAPPRGLVNRYVVNANWTSLVDLSNNIDHYLRYFTLVSSQPLLLSSRGCGEYDCQALHLVEQDGSSQVIIGDNAFSANAMVREIDGRYYAFGGLFTSPQDNGFERCLNQDGIHVMSANSLEEIRNGAWLAPRHGWTRKPDGNGTDQWTVSYDHLAVDGFHMGVEDAIRPSGAAQFDSKLSVVRHRGRWLLYTRANLYVAGGHGGRYVMVAKSRTQEPWGRDAYGPFENVNIEGYDRDGPGNVYFGAVSYHPFDNDMLIALYPVNYGQANTGNGVGESLIGLSMSCDGLNWSRITPLVWTRGLLGRTFDHPVDGLYMEDGHANLLVQWDVPGIAVWNGGKFDRNGNAMGHPSGKSTIRKYRLHRNAINALTSQARSSLAGCQADAHPTQTQGALQPEVLPA